MGLRSPSAKPVKLPAVMPGGKRTKLHPLLWCVENLLGERTKADLAKHLEVRSQSVYKWMGKCEEDRHFSLPGERVQAIADFFQVPPSLFRPDLYPPLKAVKNPVEAKAA